MDLVKTMAPTSAIYGHEADTQIEKPKAPLSNTMKAFQFVFGAVVGVVLTRSHLNVERELDRRRR